jgi:hypothetical protein
VDLSFLQELYSQINNDALHHTGSHISKGSVNGMGPRDWEVKTLNQLSVHLDSTQLERFTERYPRYLSSNFFSDDFWKGSL